MEIGLKTSTIETADKNLLEQDPLLFFESNDQALLRKKLRHTPSPKTQNSKSAISEEPASDQGMLSRLVLETKQQDSLFDNDRIGQQSAFRTQNATLETIAPNSTKSENAGLAEPSHSGVDTAFTQLGSGDSAFASSLASYNVPDTGNIAIDSLLTGRKWNDKTITYSFYDGGSYYASNTGLTEVSDVIKSYVRHILEDLIEPLINLDFVEVSDAGGNYGQLRYMFEKDHPTAHGYYPSNVPRGGDVLLGTKNKRDFEMGPGSFRYQTLIHETMHVLGLKHPGDYNGTGSGDPPFIPYDQDHRSNTLMSYNNPGLDRTYTRGITPMSYDIRALQYLYGAKAHQTGDTTYKFDSVYGYTVNGEFFGNKTKTIKQTIWDSKGLDTVDFSNLSFNSSGYRFDLNDGGWLTTQKSYNGASYKARSDNSNTRYYTTAYGTAIAYDVTIENVVNSSSSDYILLNQAANTISGYTVGKKVGNDIVVDADGKDTLNLSEYKSSAVTQTTSGNDLVLTLDGDGTITIKDYFTVPKDNRIKILLDGATNPVDPPIDPPVDPPNTTTQVSFQQGVDGFYGTVDTYLYTNSSASHAASTSLKVDGRTGSGGIEQVLLRFDDLFGSEAGQIASNAQIKSASLQLEVTNKGDSLELHRMLTNWSDTDTWSSLGDGIQINDIEAASQADVVTGPISVGIHTFDVTASLQAWQTNPSNNFGWALLPTGSDGVYFNSAEGLTAPRLVVDFTVPPPPASPVPPAAPNAINGTSGEDTLNGTQDKDIIRGHDGADVLIGRNGNDELLGGRGGDTLRGGKGNDVLKGSYGADILVGGQGKDKLTGGRGDDAFVFNSIDDHRDTITDFGLGNDHLDLQQLFAGKDYASVNAFTDYVKLVQSGSNTKVQVDALGDTGDQFQTLAILKNVNVTDLTASQFKV